MRYTASYGNIQFIIMEIFDETNNLCNLGVFQSMENHTVYKYYIHGLTLRESSENREWKVFFPTMPEVQWLQANDRPTTPKACSQYRGKIVSLLPRNNHLVFVLLHLIHIYEMIMMQWWSQFIIENEKETYHWHCVLFFPRKLTDTRRSSHNAADNIQWVNNGSFFDHILCVLCIFCSN